MSAASLGPFEKFTTVDGIRVAGQIVEATSVEPTDPQDPAAYRADIAAIGSDVSSSHWVDQPTFKRLESARVIWEAEAHQ